MIFLNVLVAVLVMSAVEAQTVDQKIPPGYPETFPTGSSLDRSEGVSTPDKEQIQRSGIKSIEAWEYDAVPGKRAAEVIEGSGVKMFSAEYDTKGNEIAHTAYGPDGQVVQNISVEYDTSGFIRGSLVDSYVEAVDRVLPLRIAYEYDENNFLLRVISYDRDSDEVNLQIDYIYDDAGHVVESVSFMPGGLADMRSRYSYDDDERITEIQFYDRSRGEVVITSKYLYDVDGYEMVSYGPDNKHLESTRTNYDADGNIAEVIRRDASDRVVSDIDHTFDSEGRVIETVSSVPSADMKTRTTFRYDADGNVTEQITYNKLDEPVKIIKFVYEYYE